MHINPNLKISQFLILAIGAFAAFAAQPAVAPDAADIGVRVSKRGEWIVVDVDFAVRATALESWNVLTDYDNMARFVSNLEASRITARDGNVLTVEQKGKASRGPITFTFALVREVVLVPFDEIRSRLVSGDLEASQFTTRIVDHGPTTQISNHGEYIPNVWVPPLIGTAIIEAETRKQFQEFRVEILRRRGDVAAAATRSP